MPARGRRREAALEVAFLDKQRRTRVDRRRVEAVLRGAAAALKAEGELAVVFAGDATLRRLNARYRGKDRPTDVLAFPGPGRGALGDILISVATAARNAGEAGRTVAEELDVLALHGFLHLLGYDHETDDGAMDRLEARLRRRLLRAPRARPGRPRRGRR